VELSFIGGGNWNIPKNYPPAANLILTRHHNIYLIESFTIDIHTLNSIHYVQACSVINDYTAISEFSAWEVT
jgi:hypothetical protein